MTDATEYFVDPAALRRDAEQFSSWRGELESMADALPVDVAAPAAIVVPGLGDALLRLQGAASALQDYLHDGAEELGAIGSKLTETLRLYTEAEDASADDVARVARELDTL
jgi:hypothetical protein